MGKRAVAGFLTLPVLFLFVGCSAGPEDVRATADETVHTALFDFEISNVAAVDSYLSILPTEGNQLVQMELTVTNTGEDSLTMFAEDFQIQWGDGEEDYGVCLGAVDDAMVPYSYTLEPSGTYTGTMVAQVPTGTTQLTVAYQEVLASGKDGAAYFVEASL